MILAIIFCHPSWDLLLSSQEQFCTQISWGRLEKSYYTIHLFVESHLPFSTSSLTSTAAFSTQDPSLLLVTATLQIYDQVSFRNISHFQSNVTNINSSFCLHHLLSSPKWKAITKYEVFPLESPPPKRFGCFSGISWKIFR